MKNLSRNLKKLDGGLCDLQQQIHDQLNELDDLYQLTDVILDELPPSQFGHLIDALLDEGWRVKAIKLIGRMKNLDQCEKFLADNGFLYSNEVENG